MAEKKYIQSVTRGLDILRLLSEADEGLGVNDIATALDVANPTAHILLQTLAMRGFAKQHGTRYFLGGEVVNLFENYVTRNPLIRIKNGMQELAREFPDAVIGFAELQADEVTTRFRINPEWPGIIQSPMKARYSLYFNLSSLVLLAFLPQSISRRLRQSQSFDDIGRVYWKSVDEFDKYLEQIRSDAYVEKLTPENCSFRIAAPVWGHKNNLLGVISITLLWEEDSKAPSKTKQKQLLQSLCSKTQELSCLK